MDNVNHPNHYTQTSLECIDVMCAMFGEYAVVYFCFCNAFKYMWRYKNKNGEEDLNKAQFYLDWVNNNMCERGFDTELENLYILLSKCREEFDYEG